MTTVTPPSLPRQQKAVQAELVSRPTRHVPGRLLINGQPYSFRRIRPDRGSGCTCLIRLQKPDGEVYDVALLVDGREDCSCGSFVFQASKLGQRCKHLAALDQLGLLTPPAAAEATLRAALERIAGECGPHAARIAREALEAAECGAGEPVTCEVRIDTRGMADKIAEQVQRHAEEAAERLAAPDDAVPSSDGKGYWVGSDFYSSDGTYQFTLDSMEPEPDTRPPSRAGRGPFTGVPHERIESDDGPLRALRGRIGDLGGRRAGLPRLRRHHPG